MPSMSMEVIFSCDNSNSIPSGQLLNELTTYKTTIERYNKKRLMNEINQNKLITKHLQ